MIRCGWNVNCTAFNEMFISLKYLTGKSMRYDLLGTSQFSTLDHCFPQNLRWEKRCEDEGIFENVLMEMRHLSSELSSGSSEAGTAGSALIWPQIFSSFIAKRLNPLKHTGTLIATHV